MAKIEDTVMWLAFGAMTKRGFTNALAAATPGQLREARGLVMGRHDRYYPHITRCSLIAARIAQLEVSQ